MNEEESPNNYIKKEFLPVVTPETSKEMKDLLLQYGVWNEKWTEEKSRELLMELQEKEKRLVVFFDKDDTDMVNPHLGAEMKIVSIDVFFKNDEGQEFRLVESFQTSIFIYGKEESPDEVKTTIRVRDKKRAISGKIRDDEDAREGAVRELSEELSLKTQTELIPVENVIENKISKGYPGLMTFTVIYGYETWINKDDYMPNYANTERKLSGQEDQNEPSQITIDVLQWEKRKAA